MKATKLFTGTKTKWLPLYRRFIARLARQSSVEPNVKTESVHLGKFAIIRVVKDGIEIGLVLKRGLAGASRLKASSRSPKRITHTVLLCEAAEIDAELMSWLKAAEQLGRKTKRR